jgi:hypothetical protein
MTLRASSIRFLQGTRPQQIGTMAHIRHLDMMLLDQLFDMEGGYVLDFSDRTMARFFATELNIDIDDPAYRRNGSSKAKRLRCFLETVEVREAVRVLQALWEYRKALRDARPTEEKVQNAEGRFLDLLNRLQGLPVAAGVHQAPRQAYDRPKLIAARDELIEISKMDPHPRGYAFETFIKNLFDLYGLKARESFRLVGEQIDGSFDLESETYLLEAKWQDALVGAAELHTFHGKIEQKAAWTRGLFISQSGFTADGLVAFGRGKRVICMDGLDMYNILHREIPLKCALERKVRRAAETGRPFVSIDELFG